MLTLSKISGALPDPDEEEEGCLSFPGAQYPLKRAEWARVQGFDGDGNPVEFEATGWFARVIQHEYDHLDGKLYVNRLGRPLFPQGHEAGQAQRVGRPRADLDAGRGPGPVRPLTARSGPGRRLPSNPTRP